MILFLVERIISLFYIIGIISICYLKYEKSLQRLLKYGKTMLHQDRARGPLSWLVKLTVPKRWFLHFYVFLVTNCAVILLIYFQGDTKNLSALTYQSSNASSKSQMICSKSAIYRTTGFILVCAQATRRLYECLFVSSFNPAARMNLLHYLMGLIFYFTLSINAALGFLPTLLCGLDKPVPLSSYTKISLIIVLFLAASVDQFQNHRHLSKLKKYSLPYFRLFRWSTSPHYFDEVFIYLLIAILFNLEEPRGLTELNFIFMWLFVLVNLTVSSFETFDYYRHKYPFLRQRYSIIPGIL